MSNTHLDAPASDRFQVTGFVLSCRASLSDFLPRSLTSRVDVLWVYRIAEVLSHFKQLTQQGSSKTVSCELHSKLEYSAVGRMNACSLYSQKICPRGMRNNNGNGTSSASPRVLRTFALPIFQPDHCRHTAYLQMDRYFPHRRNLEVLQQQQREPARA
ncbi:hypothetical protein BGY98DRAFT_935350 [Russula aff. rugulosa BPL654]|nr:hypothetical protein BGY98DRAFT_935350 [Russula aff. rugulosa BPL654]